MIYFPCRCGHKFALEENTAGTSIQCPQCGTLNDVPALDDLSQLAADGTYTLRPIIPLAPAVQTLPPSDDQASIEVHPPRYDPGTGELISPLEVVPNPMEEDLARSGPLPIAKAVINYAPASTTTPSDRVLLKMFKPINLAVVGFIFVITLFMIIATVAAISGLMLIIVAVPVLLVCMVGHFANVIDETGPVGADELPRPLRQLSGYDDIWSPFCHMMLAWFLAFGPALIAWKFISPSSDARLPLGITLAVVGCFFAPALMITTSTSGTFLNLSPIRVIGVIAAIGGKYILPFLLALVLIPAYLISIVMAPIALMNLIAGPDSFWQGLLITVLAALPATLWGMHYLCWILGRLYRDYYPKFPWVLQFYEKPNISPEEEARRAKARALRDAHARRNLHNRAQ